MTDGDKFVDLPSTRLEELEQKERENSTLKEQIATLQQQSIAQQQQITALQQSQKDYYLAELRQQNIKLHRLCIVSWLITANMATSVEKIAKLEADIEELKSKRNSILNEVLQIAITNEITAIREQIIQQGNTQTISFPSLVPHLTNSFVLPSCSKLCIFNHIYISDYHSEFLSVPTGGAGND